MSIFEGYVAARKPSAETVKAWKRFLQHLSEFLNEKPAASVTPDDVIRWKDHLMQQPKKDGQPRSPKTVRETYLAAAKTVFAWAKENRKVAENPVSGITVRAGKRTKLRERGFTNEETHTILRATLVPAPERLTHKSALARRWVPWICAYSGARVNEMTQLRKQDIFKRDGVRVMNITPEAGSVKNDEARLVTLHTHLIDQGFIAVVEASKDEPLSHDPARNRGRPEGNSQYKKVPFAAQNRLLAKLALMSGDVLVR
jgi:integrase